MEEIIESCTATELTKAHGEKMEHIDAIEWLKRTINGKVDIYKNLAQKNRR